MTKLFNALVVSGPAFANQLDSETPSDQTLNVGQVPDTNISNYVLQLTGGSFSGASASLTSATQLGAGSNQFQLDFNVDITVDFANWIESGTRTVTPFRGPPYTENFGPNNCGAFSFTASGASLSATVEIAQNAQNQWEFSFVSPDTDSSNASLSFGYPGTSVLANYTNSCSNDQIHDGMESELNNIDYSSATQDAITQILDSVTESGSLGSGIVFQWTPNTFVFPQTSLGVQSGVTGLVTYNGTPFTPPSQLTPPNLPLPSIPGGNDVQIYAADYLFTSLFWAYYSAGQLSETITAGMLTDPAILNTSYFQESIQALYQEYPDAPMEVVVEQSAAPQVTFIQGYMVPAPYILTPVGLASLQSQLPKADYIALQDQVENVPFSQLASFQGLLQQVLGGDYATYGASVVTASTTATASLASQLPSTVYSALLGITNIPYPGYNAFVTALQEALGSGPAQQYGQTIEDVASVVLALLSHSPLCTFNVLWDGTWNEVLQIQITEQDYLDSFVLGVSGTAQTVQSQYQIAGNPTATLVSSEIPGVNVSTFVGLWQYVLLPEVYAKIMQEVAATGVPVPFIEGYTFQESTVALQVGYADITANVVFSS
jgi:hypothetical protein